MLFARLRQDERAFSSLGPATYVREAIFGDRVRDWIQFSPLGTGHRVANGAH
jgi:hypothetical protein